jgi:PAS domain S-box-containing protein
MVFNDTLSDLIDIDQLKKLAECHYKAAGIPVGIVDAKSGEILVGVGWQEICLRFHRAHAESARLCEESDRNIKNHILDGKPCAYRCRNGLWDIGIPILVEDQHLATLFLGQFLYEGESPDRDFFIRQAEKFGYDLSGYLTALDMIPMLSRETVNNILEYNVAFSNFIADMACKKKRLNRELDERKQAEEALIERERKFRAIFDQTFQFIELLDVDGRIIEANRTALQFAGVQGSEVAGKPLWETPWWTHSPELQETLRAALKKAASGELVRFEASHPSSDGSLYHMDFSLKPVLDEADGIAFLAEARDISERKQAEDALRESQALLSTVMESIPFEFWAIGQDGRYMMINSVCMSRYGNILGKTPEEICSGNRESETLALWQENNRRAFGGELVEGDVKYTFRRKDVVFHNIIAPVRSGDRIRGILGVNIDISERKRMEEELRKSRDELELRIQERTKELNAKTRRLEEVIGALRVLLKQREDDKKELEESVLSNVKSLIVPYVDKLKKSRLDSDQTIYLNILESHIQEIVSPFAKVLSEKYLGLTPLEVQTAGLIREGKTTKEIAETLCVSENTVSSHRFHMRKKLGLTSKKINLRTYLKSLEK